MPFFVTQIQGVQANLEPFIIGINLDTGAVGTGTAQGAADQVRDTFASNWTGIAGSFTSGTKFTKVTAYERPKTATGAASAQAEALFTPQLAGTGTGVPMPPEVAACVSLLCAEPGRTHRGRFYLPAFASSAVNAQGAMATGIPGATANWAAALLGGINTTVGPGWQVVVWSRKTASTSVVNRVRVGNQFDAQRRRQNAVGETYDEVAVSTV